ncbi:hypothetical protein R1sor_006388 [Riccia sorocarpa]|uniref:Uncharacterized protein n=1 Tax=Riccia sorocarpa TaxID=122646 RepID=A0ABD3HQ96_9MARC
MEDLEGEGIDQKIDEAWGNHPASVTDPRIRWDLAWKRMMSVLKTERRSKRSNNLNKEELLKELSKWREVLLADNSQENRTGFRMTRDLLQEVDREEAKLWRKRSQSKWIREGDTPSRYFFAIWKAKIWHETIKTLLLDKGETTEDPKKILETVDDFYTHLLRKKLSRKEPHNSGQRCCRRFNPRKTTLNPDQHDPRHREESSKNTHTGLDAPTEMVQEIQNSLRARHHRDTPYAADGRRTAAS